MAANEQYTIYVPDRSTPIRYPKSLTVEEVRSALVGSGFTACETARVVLEGDSVLRFERVQGGTKGI